MRFLHDRRGVAALEFAIVGVAFVMLLLGTIQVGLLWWTKNGLETAAMLTARCAALGSCSDPAAFAKSTASKFTLPNAVSAVSVATSSHCNAVTGYSHFTTVTLTSTVWADSLISVLAGSSIQAIACYPSPTTS